MGTQTTSGYFSGFSIISVIVGVGFLCVCLILWLLAPVGKVVLLFGMAMLFGGFANSLAFLVLHRMESAGYEVGLWRWPGKDFRLYSEYWRIAPQKGWSRWMLSGFLLCFGLAAAFLLSIPITGGNLLK